MTNTYLEFKASDLNRNPTKIFQAAKNYPVLLKRRGGPDMILVSKKELLAQAEAHETAALLLSALQSLENSRLENIRLRFPWMAVFAEDKEKECADQMLAGVKEFFTSGIALPFVSLVHKWKHLAREVAQENPPPRRN
jgi:PHD/YefM family antitoxin component YafN of YafNO toxin-antitoxin module